MRKFNFRYHVNLNYDENIFLDNKKEQRLFAKLNIDTANYSSICAIPIANQWSSKFGSTSDEHLLTTKMLTCSFFSGIPWLNSKLSRVSTSQTMQSGQFTSNELIEREVFKDLDTNKKILLIYFKENQRTKSEKYVLDHSTLLHEDSLYAFYAFKPIHSFYKTRDSILSNFDVQKLTFDVNEANQHVIVHKYFDEGAKMISKAQNEKIVLDTILNFKSIGEKMELSLWSLVDYRTQNSPVVKIVRMNSKNDLIDEKYFNPAQSDDVQHMKLRVQYNYETKFSTERIQLFLPKGKNHLFERILIRPENVQVYDTFSGVKYLNNYRLE